MEWQVFFITFWKVVWCVTANENIPDSCKHSGQTSFVRILGETAISSKVTICLRFYLTFRYTIFIDRTNIEKTTNKLERKKDH